LDDVLDLAILEVDVTNIQRSRKKPLVEFKKTQVKENW
jgi:hypothetical protein